MSDTVERSATEIAETTAGAGLLSGKSPTEYAAVAIYAASTGRGTDLRNVH